MDDPSFQCVLLLHSVYPKHQKDFSHRVTAELSFVWPFVKPFPWIFLRNSYLIQIENGLQTFCKPQDHFVPTTKSCCAI